MLSFIAILQKFSSKGEKTGWTYVDIPPDILTGLQLKSKKEFRLKGFIDDTAIHQLACYPIGDGNYIVALNAELRKKLGKKEGAMVTLKVAVDNSPRQKSQELLDCLQDDAAARSWFESLTPSHQNYFHTYILTAKTEATITARVVNSLDGLHKKQSFSEMIRALQGKNK